jgi:hypothetical protein
MNSQVLDCLALGRAIGRPIHPIKEVIARLSMDADEIANEQLYRLKNEDLYFYTGLIHGNLQAITGIQLPELILIEFGLKGDYIRIVTKELELETGRSDQDSYGITEEDALEQLLTWQNEIEFLSAAITVKKFFLPDRWIGIKDLPDHYQEVLDRPQDPNDERDKQLREDIRRWMENGDYVFYWDEEYYISKEGDIESS